MIFIRKILFFLILLLFILLSSGCNTSKVAVKNRGTVIPEENTEKQSKKIESSKSSNIIESNEKEKKLEISAVNDQEQNQNKKITDKEVKETIEEKIISKEYREKETGSILDTIEKLEQCYETGNFEKWKSLLTPAYKEKYNDPVFLKEHGWNANDLKSFFYLLIQTREENGIKSLPISRVEFVNPNKAYVYVLFKGKEFPKPQHTFIKIGNSWYKGLPDEGE